MACVSLALLLSIDAKVAARDASSLKMAMRLRKLKASRMHRKGVESFLSINQMSSAAGSMFSGNGASSMLSSGLSELSQMSSVSSSVIGKSSISEIESTAESGVESAMESELEDDMEEDIESVIEDEEEEALSELDLARMEAQIVSVGADDGSGWWLPFAAAVCGSRLWRSIISMKSAAPSHATDWALQPQL